MIRLQPYTPQDEAMWNELVAQSKDGTFLLNRQFMDYHSYRFTDCSLLFYRGSRAVACLPANYVKDTETVYSHQGLTYGGLLLDTTIGSVEVMQVFNLFMDYYRRELGAKRMVYKPIPYIYHRQPTEEPLYVLFRKGARLTARGLSTAVNLYHPLPLQARRRSGIRKGEERGLQIVQTVEREDYQEFWNIVNEGLQDRHNVRPVHSVDEMMLLMRRFPNNIRLWVERNPQRGNMVAGAWLFITDTTVHVQYMATSNEGRSIGALDYLIAHIIDAYTAEVRTAVSNSAKECGLAYFDFGISTEADGRNLNEGLVFQKEGFGARGVCYDFWELEL